MENCHSSWNFPYKMVIFYSYVKLPEGIPSGKDTEQKTVEHHHLFIMFHSYMKYQWAMFYSHLSK